MLKNLLEHKKEKMTESGQKFMISFLIPAVRLTLLERYNQ
jgi:hypothetical protein